MNSTQRIQQHFEEAAQVLERVRHDDALLQAIDQAGKSLIGTLANGGKIIYERCNAFCRRAKWEIP